MKHKIHTSYCALLVLCTVLLALLASCGPTVNQLKPQQTVKIDAGFQAQLSPMPTVPAYRCGAWSSNNIPGTYSTIVIYARLTKDVLGVGGVTAQAVAHFQDNDVTLNERPVSDKGGYVSFTLPLQGRQPYGVPTTVNVSFKLGGLSIPCSPAFFTPQ